MLSRINTHLVTLPRWFALPAAVAAVVLGGILFGGSALNIFLAVLAGSFLMAGAHSFNTFLDYSWTKLDQGEVQERSRPKEYTVGQQPLGAGVMKPVEVLANALGWYILSAIPTAFISAWVSPIIWIPWVLVAACTFWYSWGKLHYQCEVALGIGFGSFAVMFGASTASNPNLWTAFLAGIPFLLIWGFAAEFVDQAMDAEFNWHKGLRNLGAWAWQNSVSVPMFLGWLVAISYITQLALVQLGVLNAGSMLSLLAVPILAYGAVIMGNEYKKEGVLLLLGGIFVHMIGLVVGQGVYNDSLWG